MRVRERERVPAVPEYEYENCRIAYRGGRFLPFDFGFACAKPYDLRASVFTFFTLPLMERLRRGASAGVSLEKDVEAFLALRKSPRG